MRMSWFAAFAVASAVAIGGLSYQWRREYYIFATSNVEYRYHEEGLFRLALKDVEPSRKDPKVAVIYFKKPWQFRGTRVDDHEDLVNIIHNGWSLLSVL